MFYHIKNLQGTKTAPCSEITDAGFYHIKNLQGTKTTWHYYDNPPEDLNKWEILSKNYGVNDSNIQLINRNMSKF